MEKVVVRNKLVTSLLSNFIFFNNDKTFNSREEFLNFYGADKVMRAIFKEEETFAFLRKKYNEYVKSGDNDYFFEVTLIDDEYGIFISKKSSHIYLVHLEPILKINNEKILNWNYCNNKKYIGDTWWSNNEEVINDISRMTMVDFYKKYKGF